MPVPKLARQQILQLTEWVGEYIADQRSHFLDTATSIPTDLSNVVLPFFPVDVLRATRIVRGRAPDPEFYARLKALGIHNAPPFSDMAGITFQDVIVHVEPLTKTLLFHELVHAVQYKHLGLKGFAESYVRGFLTGGTYEAIPLEKQAYALEEQFAENPTRKFSVEQDVLQRIQNNQF